MVIIFLVGYVMLFVEQVGCFQQKCVGVGGGNMFVFLGSQVDGINQVVVMIGIMYVFVVVGDQCVSIVQVYVSQMVCIQCYVGIGFYWVVIK